MTDRLIVNPDNVDYAKHQYLVALAKIVSPWLVYADYEAEALDIAADFAEERGWEGYFLTPEDEVELEQFEQVDYAGNHGRPIDSDEISIRQVDSTTQTYAYGTDNFRVTLYNPIKRPDHRALDDCLATLELIREMANSKTTKESEE